MKTITRFIILAALSLVATFSYAQELVTNGNFEAGQTGWTGNAFNVVTEGGNSYNAANVTTAGNAWDVNLSQVLSLTEKQTYKLVFDAWSDRERTIIAGIGLNEDPWAASTKTVTLGTASQTYTLILVAPATSANSRVIFDMGAAVGFVGIDNVSLTAVAPTCNDGVQNGDETGVDCGGSCEPCQVAGPTTAAPTPPARVAADVVSVFSEAYTNIAVNEWGPNWGPSSSRINDVTVADETAKLMVVNAGQTFAGIDFAPSAFDATEFTHFHMDYWIADPIPVGQVINIKLSNHKGGAGETSAIQYTAVPSQGGAWVQLDIPLASFTAASDPANLDRSAIAQIVNSVARADLDVPVNIYLDNIYFHKNTTSTGLKNHNATDVTIYPNPVVDVLTIKTDEVISEINIHNLLGQTVKTFSVNALEKNVSMNELPAGNYLATVKFANGTSATKKIIKL